VELVAANIVGRYARGEHGICVVALSNGDCVNRVFEQGRVPYGPQLKPGFEASKEATLNHNSDVGAGPTGKHVKVSDRKMLSSKAYAALKSVGVASSKAALPNVTHAKSTPKTSVAARVGDLLKPGMPLRSAIPKTAMMVTAQRARALKISTGTKRPAAAPSPTMKGKHARIELRPPLASAAAHKASVRPQAPAGSDSGRVAYSAMLDSVPSIES
jgi:hypothetical protein